MVGCTGNRLFEMLKDDILVDVTFIIQETEVKSHRAVAGSRGGLLRELVESKAERVEICDDISPQTFKTVLEYLYTDVIAISDSNIFELMHAAKVFNLTDIEQQCAKDFKARLSETNIGLYAKEALHLDAIETLKVCQDYFGKNTTKLIKSKKFLEISNEVLVALCASNEIDCPERKLFDACIKWANNMCQEQNLEDTPQNLRAVLGDVLKKIRFSSMLMEDFHKIIVPMKILTFDEVGEIIVEWDKTERRTVTSDLCIAINEVPIQNTGDPEYAKLTKQYFKFHTKAFTKTQEFLEVSYDLLLALCSSEGIEFSELELFSACVEWAKHECNRQNLLPNSLNIRSVLGEVLSQIIFPVIPMADFIEVIVPLEILTCEEVVRILVENQTGQKKTQYLNENRTLIKVVIKGVNVAKAAWYNATKMRLPLSTKIAELKKMKIFDGGKVCEPAHTFKLKMVTPHRDDDIEDKTLASLYVPGQDIVLNKQ